MGVPAIEANCGGPEYVTSSLAVAGFTVALCATLASRTAPRDCCVPGTELSTGATGLSAGMRANSAGRLFEADDHGPLRPGARNQRPATSTKYDPVASSMNSGMTGLLTYMRPVP